MMLHVSGVNRYRETAGWKLHRLDAAGMSIELPGDPVSSDRPVISIMLEEHSVFNFYSGNQECERWLRIFAELIKLCWIHHSR
jgi:hypothetical protein